MFKLFSTRRHLVEETPLSRFVHKASAAEKRKIYNRVIREAADEQRSLIEIVQVRRTSQDRAPA